MKNQRGVTLIALTVYIIVLILIISILSLISEMFFTNIKYIENRGKYVSEFNKFNMYFIDDVKNNTDIENCSDEKVIFKNGTSYTFQDNGIYRDKVKICNNVSGKFNFSEIESGGITKKIITVEMIIKGSQNLQITNEYVLKYW